MKKLFSMPVAKLLAGSTLLFAAPLVFANGPNVNWSVTVGAGGYPAPHVYSQPQAVYVQPQPVYVHPQRVYVAPQPMYVQPATVVQYGQPYYVEKHRKHHWKHRHHRHHDHDH